MALVQRNRPGQKSCHTKHVDIGFFAFALDFRPDAATVLKVEEILAQLSTEELIRMLELLDMLESKSPIQASERELAILQYLLNNYPN